jgi:Ca2+/Na+ antiporter
MFTRLRIDRWEGAILLAGYVAYTVTLLARPG